MGERGIPGIDWLFVWLWLVGFAALALLHLHNQGRQVVALERIAVALEAERAPTEVDDGEAP